MDDAELLKQAIQTGLTAHDRSTAHRRALEPVAGAIRLSPGVDRLNFGRMHHVHPFGNGCPEQGMRGSRSAHGKFAPTRFVQWLGLGLLWVAVLGVRAQAAGPWKTAGGFSTDWEHLTFEEHPLRGNLHFLHASGGNIVALVTPEGTLLVDDEFAQVAPILKAQLKSMGAGPVHYVITTHYHPDHSGSNGAFIKDGATVIAQTNCRADLLESHYSAYWKTRTPAIPESEAPTVTFDRNMTVFFGGERVDLSHVCPAHTDGDTVVYFRNANVVHMGDIYVNGLYPYIDVLAKGSIDGYITAIDDVLSQINDSTLIVPGHGPVAKKADLIEYRYMLKTVRDRVAASVSNHKRLEMIIYEAPTEEYDAKCATDRVGPEAFTAMVYQSLTHQRLDWSMPKE